MNFDTAKPINSPGDVSTQPPNPNKPSPNAIMSYIRNVARSYIALIPGATYYVDRAFDRLEEVLAPLMETHRDQATDLLQATYEDIKTAINEGQMDLKTALKVLSIIRHRGQEFSNLAQRFGVNAYQVWGEELEKAAPYLQKIPQVKALLEQRDVMLALMIGGGSTAIWNKIKEVTEKKGEVDEKQVEEIKRMIREEVRKSKEGW